LTSTSGGETERKSEMHNTRYVIIYQRRRSRKKRGKKRKKRKKKEKKGEGKQNQKRKETVS
jgi:hypothetical protein